MIRKKITYNKDTNWVTELTLSHSHKIHTWFNIVPKTSTVPHPSLTDQHLPAPINKLVIAPTNLACGLGKEFPVPSP